MIPEEFWTKIVLGREKVTLKIDDVYLGARQFHST